MIYEELDIEQRAMMSENGGTLTINAASPSIAGYLGDRAQEWPGQDDIHFRTMLAEVITLTVARFVIQRRRLEQLPSYRLFYEHMQLMEKWLPQVHRALVPPGELSSRRALSGKRPRVIDNLRCRACGV